MSIKRTAFVLLVLIAPLGACSTSSGHKATRTAVSTVIEPKAKTVGLQEAATAYCDNARSKGLATGETGLGSIVGMFTGKNNDKNAYWRKIGADTSAPAGVVSRVRADMTDSAKGLADLSKLAKTTMSKAQASKDDVNVFEKALIHARQSRDSFSDALTQVNKRSNREYKISEELAPLDEALTAARKTADELAASSTGKKAT